MICFFAARLIPGFVNICRIIHLRGESRPKKSLVFIRTILLLLLLIRSKYLPRTTLFLLSIDFVNPFRGDSHSRKRLVVALLLALRFFGANLFLEKVSACVCSDSP